MIELPKHMKKLIIFITILFGFSLFFFTYVSAQIINKEYTRTYNVRDDYVEVAESKKIQITQPNWFISAGAEEVFTLFNPVKNDPDHDEKLQKTQDSIRVTDSRGATLSYTTELTSAGNITLRVAFPIRIDYPNQYTIYLNYNSYGLLIKGGKLRDVYIPSFAVDYSFETETTSEEVITKVVIPKSYGQINFATPENTRTEEGDNYIVSFSKESLVGETGWVEIGTEQYYNFKINQPVVSTSEADFFLNKYKVLVPKDINSGPIKQRVHFTNISPTPTNSFRDDDGNLFFEFSFPSNQSGEIIVEGYAVINQDNTVDFRDSGNLSEIPQEIVDKNTKPAPYWESDSPEIMETAAMLEAQVPGEDKNVYELVTNTYQFVIDRIDYSEVKRFGINERQGALATLEGGAAVCMEYSDLFIALMRAQGVPARGAFGYGYSALDSDEDSQTTNHQWAEVYIPKLGEWISVDTTWGESGQELIGGDLNHFYTNVASIAPDIPASTTVEYYGTLDEIPEKDFMVTATATLPTGTGEDGETLYGKYHSDQTTSELTKVFDKFRLLIFEIDSTSSDVLRELLPGISDPAIALIKLIPIILIASIAVYFIIKKIKKRKSNSDILLQ